MLPRGLALTISRLFCFFVIVGRQIIFKIKKHLTLVTHSENGGTNRIANYSNAQAVVGTNRHVLTVG